MKKIKILSITCTALLIMLALASCGNREMISVVSEGKSPYRFVLAADVSEYTAGKVLDLAAKIRDLTGATIPVVRDFSAQGEYEILIGNTNRAVSKIAGELSEFEYFVGEDGGAIVAAGGSDYAISLAVELLGEKYFKNMEPSVPKGEKNMKKYEPIDNSGLLPKYVADSEVSLISAEPGGKPMTPDWAGSLIMMELHVETATTEGTFEAAVKVLDHAASLGVNGLWITPVFDKGPDGNGYSNLGLHTVEPALTGKEDYEEGWKVVKWFVDEAHKRNIRIFLDIITWGTTPHSDLYKDHPDWFNGKAWGNEAFDWTNQELREWFIQKCVEMIEKTGADGLRCDCEPVYTGYELFAQVRSRLLEKGRKILIIAEDGAERQSTYDFEQDGVLNYLGWGRGEQYVNPKRFYIDEFDIVESVKYGQIIGMKDLQTYGAGGEYRFYTYCVSNHDFQRTIVNKNRLVLGYQAIFSPFIPLWYFGEEFGMTAQNMVIYFLSVDWSLLADGENTAFLEDIKAYIRIRRTYTDIFEYWPENHRESNICTVKTDGELSAYARYRDNRAVLVVPNNNSDGKISFNVEIPFEGAGLSGYKTYVLTDLLTGNQLAKGGSEELSGFVAQISCEHIGVYLVEGLS